MSSAPDKYAELRSITDWRKHELPSRVWLTAEDLDQLRALLSEVDELRADAARYRWLRQKGVVVEFDYERHEDARLDKYVDVELKVDAQIAANAAARVPSSEAQ